jgi:hypothetical protein
VQVASRIILGARRLLGFFFSPDVPAVAMCVLALLAADPVTATHVAVV